MGATNTRPVANNASDKDQEAKSTYVVTKTPRRTGELGSVAKRRHALATDASPWDVGRDKIRESRSDGMRRASGVERQDGGVVLESVISRRLQVVAGAGLCASLVACRRFATLGRSGWHVHHGFAPMAIAWRRFATGTKSLRVAT